MKELIPMFPKHEVKVLGEVIKIKTFPVKEFPAVFQHVEFFSIILANMQSGEVENIIGAVSLALSNKGERLMSAVVELLTITTGMSEEWILQLDYDLAIQLFAEVIEANKDFFKKFGQTAKELVVLETPKQPTTGEPELHISSEED